MILRIFAHGMAMKDDKLYTPARVALTAYLKGKKMRRTPERYAILEKIFSTDAHFHVDDLHRKLEAEGYHVSLSTVYATRSGTSPRNMSGSLTG